jgi:amino acid transporter
MDSRGSHLPRILGAPSAAAVMVGLVIGSGIFRVPSSVALSVETVGAVALVWIVGGLISLFGALVVAELSCLYPEAGGVYVFIREAYGPLPAFLYGWTRLLLLVPASVGAMSLILAAYLRPLLPFEAVDERWIAAAVIVFVTALNYRSLLWSSRLENVISFSKVVLLLVLALALFTLGDGRSGALSQPMGLAPASWTGFGLALVTVMWTYSGWSSIAALAGEVRDPGRNMPKALIWGIGVVLLVYLGINGAYLFVLPLDEVAGSTMVATDAAAAALGDVGSLFVSGIVVLATFGAVQAAMMFNPRIFFAMANDGLLFSPIGRVHNRFLTPHLATVFTSILGIGYVAVRSFEQLAQAFILGVWPFHILMVLAVFHFRGTRPEAERPYKTWGYPVVPALFLAASGLMILNALLAEPGLTLFGFGLILAGIPVFLLRKKRG